MRELRTSSWAWATAAVALALTATTVVSTQQAASTASQRDFSKELANKMAGSFVIATAGDLSIQEPVGKQMSPDLQRVLRQANSALGYVEFYQADRRPLPGDASAKEAAQDLADVGFDLVGLGESAGGEGVRRLTLDALSALNLSVVRDERVPVFHNLAQGRAAMVVGPNPVRLSTANYVTADQLRQLKAIRDAIVARRNDPDVSRPIGVPQDLPDQVTIFNDTFVVGPVAGEIKQETSPADRQANILAVRNAKEFADFVVFSMPRPPVVGAAHHRTDIQPGDFVVSLAHEMVENGMDLYAGHGNHMIQGIEIYKGRPIFYGMGDLSVHKPFTGAPANLTAYIATSSYQDGALQEVRIYPVDLGVDPATRPVSKVGVPMVPSPEVAARILGDIQRASQAFGTTIAIEGGIGVIRVPRSATGAIGQGIRDFGPPASSVGGGGGRGGRGGGGRGAGGAGRGGA